MERNCGIRRWWRAGWTVEGDHIFVAKGALVPVLGDALLAFGPDEVARLPSDREERFQEFLVGETFRVFSGLIGHETVDESVDGRLHSDAGEGPVEE
jgi:hypothetical protein